MQQDYIMRIVEQFVQAIADIMLRRKAGKYKEAREQIQTATRYLLKTDLNLLLLYDDDHILDHFKDFAGQLEIEKCVLGADLFYQLALIEEAQQQMTQALRLKILCLYLYTSALPKQSQFQTPQYFEKAKALIQELKNQSLSDKVQLSVRSYETFASTHSFK
jgi:hypothetical protein